MRRLWIGSLRLQLVSQPALPEVSGPRACRMARSAAGRVTASAVFPRRLHPAGGGGGDRVPEQTRGLRHPVPRGAEAMRDVAANPRHLGAEIGAVAVLHSWGQTMTYHPHLHCIVPAGGLSPDQTRWIASRPGFLLPVRVLSRRFREVFVARLRAAFAAGELRFSGKLATLAEPAVFAERLADLSGVEWVVYAKPPFAGPERVLAYLGRYTHRVAIANSRLTRLTDGEVDFTWKDYRDG